MNIRSLFLASAALVAAGGAFAADLPAKQAAPAADAVRACPAYVGLLHAPGLGNVPETWRLFPLHRHL